MSMSDHHAYWTASGELLEEGLKAGGTITWISIQSPHATVEQILQAAKDWNFYHGAGIQIRAYRVLSVKGPWALVDVDKLRDSQYPSDVEIRTNVFRSLMGFPKNL